MIINVNGTASAAPGTGQVNINIEIATPVLAITKTALASGANTITIPTGTSLIIVQLPVGNAQNVTVKGVTGDTGLPMLITGVAMWQPLSSATTFCLTAGGAIATLTSITFL